MNYKVNDAVAVTLADGSRAVGRIIYLDDVAGEDGVICADVEVLEPKIAAPVVWVAVTELQPTDCIGACDGGMAS